MNTNSAFVAHWLLMLGDYGSNPRTDEKIILRFELGSHVCLQINSSLCKMIIDSWINKHLMQSPIIFALLAPYYYIETNIILLLLLQKYEYFKMEKIEKMNCKNCQIFSGVIIFPTFCISLFSLFSLYLSVSLSVSLYLSVTLLSFYLSKNRKQLVGWMKN